MKNNLFHPSPNIAGAWAVLTVAIIISISAFVVLYVTGLPNVTSILISVILAGILGILGAIWVDKLSLTSKQQVNSSEETNHAVLKDIKKLQEETAATKVAVEKTQKALASFVLGYQLLEQKRKDQAQIAFQKILADQPDDPQANYALGRIYSGDKRYDEAIQCFKKALDAEPGFVEAKMELGLALRRQADQEFEEATKGIDKEHNGNEWRKAVKERNAKYQEAIRYLEEANKALPGNWDILGALGGIYRRLGVYDSALSYYQEAYETNPDSSYALGNVAVLSYAEGTQDAARQAFEKTIDLATQLIGTQSSRERWWDYYDRAMAKLVLTQIGDPTKAQEYNTTGSYSDDYEKAIELTLNSASFESVLQGLNFLKEFQHKYTPHEIAGLDEIINRIERAKDEMEAKEKTQKRRKRKEERLLRS